MHQQNQVIASHFDLIASSWIRDQTLWSYFVHNQANCVQNYPRFLNLQHAVLTNIRENQKLAIKNIMNKTWFTQYSRHLLQSMPYSLWTFFFNFLIITIFFEIVICDGEDKLIKNHLIIQGILNLGHVSFIKFAQKFGTREW